MTFGPSRDSSGIKMSYRLPPLNGLRSFEAAARHLNFTRAAIELCVSQGAVSHQVAQLERRLGTRLFDRLPRGLALTDDGQALVPVLAETVDRIGATLDPPDGADAIDQPDHIPLRDQETLRQFLLGDPLAMPEGRQDVELR